MLILSSIVETLAYAALIIVSLIFLPVTSKPCKFFAKLLQSSGFTFIWGCENITRSNWLRVNVPTHESIARLERDGFSIEEGSKDRQGFFTRKEDEAYRANLYSATLGKVHFQSSEQPAWVQVMLEEARKFARRDEALLEYIQNVLNDRSFQEDPESYLKAWKERRGNTEVMNFPEDDARPFFDARLDHFPTFQPAYEQPAWVQEMLQEAQDFARDNEPLLEYIQNILNDRSFQEDPESYLKAWKERRGGTEQMKLPEDKARPFFDARLDRFPRCQKH